MLSSLGISPPAAGLALLDLGKHLGSCRALCSDCPALLTGAGMGGNRLEEKSWCSWRDLGGKQVCLYSVLSSLDFHSPGCCRLQLPNSTSFCLWVWAQIPIGLGLSWQPSLCLQSEQQEPSPTMRWLFCTAFPQGAFSGRAHGARALTGSPFLPELFPAVQGQKAAVSPQTLAEQCQRCATVSGDQGNNGPLPNSACALCGQAAWLKPFIKDKH